MPGTWAVLMGMAARKSSPRERSAVPKKRVRVPKEAEQRGEDPPTIL